MSSKVTTTVNSRPGQKGRGVDLYLLLLLAQTLGIVILVGNFLPLYRKMVLDFSSYKPDQQPWWIGAVLLVQAAYWFRVRLQPPLPVTRNNVLGHIILFVARLSFVSVTASFTVMFLNRFQDLRAMDYPPLRALLILLMFFTVFCWTLELERLAKALQRPEGGTRARQDVSKESP